MTDVPDSVTSENSKPHDPNVLGWAILLLSSLIQAAVLVARGVMERLRKVVSP